MLCGQAPVILGTGAEQYLCLPFSALKTGFRVGIDFVVYPVNTRILKRTSMRLTDVGPPATFGAP
jgi:hypothetical protein